jgi:hypothetical protein
LKIELIPKIDTDLILKFYESIPQDLDINVIDNSDQTILHYLIHANARTFLNYHMKAINVDPEHKDNKSRTAFDLAEFKYTLLLDT